jgi:hypothetical protein
MEPHYILSDTEFEDQFQNCKFNPNFFSHEAHLRLAWIHIKRYGEETAISNINTQLINFTCHLGAEDKYNRTLTTAAIKAVHHFINKSRSGNFIDFISEFPQLKHNFRELMAFHYKTDIFNSEKAKLEYFEPDLAPFD